MSLGLATKGMISGTLTAPGGTDYPPGYTASALAVSVGIEVPSVSVLRPPAIELDLSVEGFSLAVGISTPAVQIDITEENVDVEA